MATVIGLVKRENLWGFQERGIIYNFLGRSDFRLKINNKEKVL